VLPEIAGTSGAGRLLYRTMETLLQTADALTLAEADAAVDALLMMAAGLLEHALANEQGSSSSGDAMLDKALAFIDRNLASPDLSPALLAENIPLSRSSLYRLFEPLGGVSNAILQRRLERAMKALLSGSAEKAPLRSIARNVGFDSEAQLSRAFRGRFGVTPHRFYEMVRRKDHAGLAAQAERAGFLQPPRMDRICLRECRKARMRPTVPKIRYDTHAATLGRPASAIASSRSS
jgi:AraC-like DNA-binding protein